MKKFLVFSLSLIIVFTLSACSISHLKKQETKIDEKISVVNEDQNTTNNEDTSSSKNKKSNQEDKGKKEKRKKYNKLIKNKLFTDFNFDDSFEITLEEYDDFNNDGVTEALIGLKNPINQNTVSQIVYLKIKDDETLELLDQVDVSEMMNITDCKIISIKDSHNKLICINYSESEQLKVFVLYRLENNQIILTYSGFPYGNIGETLLLDKDGDGVYEGYKVESYGISTYYNPIYLNYEFYYDDYVGAKCVDGYAEIQDYPDNPKDLVLQYNYLSEIRNNIRGNKNELIPIKNLDKRLSLLAKDSVKVDNEYIYDSSILENTAIGLEPMLDYDIEIIGNKASAEAKIVGEISKDDNVYVNKLLRFELERDTKTGKWQITNQEIVPYQSKLLEALNNPEDEEEDLYSKRLIWGMDHFEERNYSLELDGVYKGDISLYNQLIHENESYVLVYSYLLNDIYNKENNDFLQNLSDERKLEWYFVEFFDGDHEYKDFAGFVYIMTEAGFNEFMRTGEVVDNDDMHLVARNYPLDDLLDKNQKGWHHYIEIEGGLENIYDGAEIIYHGYSNSNETNYYERFNWKRGIGLIEYESGYGAEKDTIKLSIYLKMRGF